MFNLLQAFFLPLAFSLFSLSEGYLTLPLIFYVKRPWPVLSLFAHFPLSAEFRWFSSGVEISTCRSDPLSLSLFLEANPRQSKQFSSDQLCPLLLIVKPEVLYCNLHLVHYSEKFWGLESREVLGWHP